MAIKKTLSIEEQEERMRKNLSTEEFAKWKESSDKEIIIDKKNVSKDVKSDIKNEICDKIINIINSYEIDVNVKTAAISRVYHKIKPIKGSIKENV